MLTRTGRLVKIPFDLEEELRRTAYAAKKRKTLLTVRTCSMFVAVWLCYQNAKLSFTVWDCNTEMGNGALLGSRMLGGRSGSNQASDHANYAFHTSSKKPKLGTEVPVFYNLYVSHERDAARVKALVNDQFSFLRPEHHPIYVNSIGYHIDTPNTTLLKHYSTGSEAVTLQALWEYCKSHKDKTVVYMHSKGSFTATPENNLLRRFLTKGALSDECANMPATCNVCSSRFSPLPHPHTSGNMWAARCDYVSGLIQPKDRFRKVMQQFRHKGPPVCTGRLRYALEHWIHSSPRVKPCDLYANSSFTYNYENIPEVEDFDISLAPAPRFDHATFAASHVCVGQLGTLQDRIEEYQILYNISIPDESWWGWKLWDVSYDEFMQQSKAERIL